MSQVRQGKDSVCDYAIRFRTLAAESGWNDAALYDVFLKGLNRVIQDILVPLDLPSDIDALIVLVVRTENRQSQLQRQREIQHKSTTKKPATLDLRWPTPPRPASETPVRPPLISREEPMQLGRARLTSKERQRRQQEGRVFTAVEWVISWVHVQSRKPRW